MCMDHRLHAANEALGLSSTVVFIHSKNLCLDFYCLSFFNHITTNLKCCNLESNTSTLLWLLRCLCFASRSFFFFTWLDFPVFLPHCSAFTPLHLNPLVTCDFSSALRSKHHGEVRQHVCSTVSKTTATSPVPEHRLFLNPDPENLAHACTRRLKQQSGADAPSASKPKPQIMSGTWKSSCGPAAE